MGEATASRGLIAALPQRLTLQHLMLRHAPSVRAHLAGLILAIIVPLLAFSAFLVLRAAVHDQGILASTVRARTREAAVAIEHTLYWRRTQLLLLAASRHLVNGDFEAFQARAAELARPDNLTVVLSDPSGRQIVRAGSSSGAVDPGSVQRVAATGLPSISNLERDPVTGAPVIAINVPILRDGTVVYVLGLDIAPLLPAILADLDLDPRWLVAVSDRTGRTIARSRAPERFVGEMGRTTVLDQFRSAAEGWFPLVSRDGIPLYTAFAHVPMADWTISVGIPEEILFAPVRRSTALFMLIGGVTLVVALLLAKAIGGRITAAFATLVDNAAEIGRGERVVLRPTGLKEADAVAHALDDASGQLVRGAEERAVLLQRSLSAEEAERRRLSRELHDSLGQYLTALRIGLNAIGPTCGGARERVMELKRLTNDLGREMSRIAWELRPMALDDLGLKDAITQYLEEWADRSRLEVDLETNLGSRRLPQPVETTLFRVLQEAVTNVVKHAGASRIAVILDARDHEVRLTVEDDGRGFDVADGGSERLALCVGHLGLQGLRERLELIGGGLEIESGELGGTTVFVRIPL
jgi:signal transduction histidine kinase